MWSLAVRFFTFVFFSLSFSFSPSTIVVCLKKIGKEDIWEGGAEIV